MMHRASMTRGEVNVRIGNAWLNCTFTGSTGMCMEAPDCEVEDGDGKG